MAMSGTGRAVLRPSFHTLGPAFRQFGGRGWLTALAAGIGAAVVTGIPVVIIDNPWFQRMTPVRPQDYAFWLASALLIGLIAGTYTATARAAGAETTVAGGFLSFLAIGCPICNKLVVLLLGVGGALTFFGPAQAFIGIASLLLLSWTLLLRADAIAGTECAVPGVR